MRPYIRQKIEFGFDVSMRNDGTFHSRLGALHVLKTLLPKINHQNLSAVIDAIIPYMEITNQGGYRRKSIMGFAQEGKSVAIEALEILSFIAVCTPQTSQTLTQPLSDHTSDKVEYARHFNLRKEVLTSLNALYQSCFDSELVNLNHTL